MESELEQSPTLHHPQMGLEHRAHRGRNRRVRAAGGPTSLQAWGPLLEEDPGTEGSPPTLHKTTLDIFLGPNPSWTSEVFGLELMVSQLPVWSQACRGTNVGTFPHYTVPFQTR